MLFIIHNGRYIVCGVGVFYGRNSTYSGKNLKSIREKEKLSLEKVSQLTGVSKTMIGQIERGNQVRH